MMVTPNRRTTAVASPVIASGGGLPLASSPSSPLLSGAVFASPTTVEPAAIPVEESDEEEEECLRSAFQSRLGASSPLQNLLHPTQAPQFILLPTVGVAATVAGVSESDVAANPLGPGRPAAAAAPVTSPSQMPAAPFRTRRRGRSPDLSVQDGARERRSRSRARSAE